MHQLMYKLLILVYCIFQKIIFTILTIYAYIIIAFFGTKYVTYFFIAGFIFLLLSNFLPYKNYKFFKYFSFRIFFYIILILLFFIDGIIDGADFYEFSFCVSYFALFSLISDFFIYLKYQKQFK